MDQEVQALTDDEYINRILYDPECVADDGSIAPSAISISDLKRSGVSMNRDGVKKSVVGRLISDAKEKKPDDRQDVLVARVQAQAVRSIKAIVPNKKVAKGQAPLEEAIFTAEASPQPIDDTVDPPFPANPAHAHILSLHGGDSTLKKLRLDYLLPLFQNPISLPDFYAILNDVDG